MNVLVIAPHPDDETIGCGGALYGHARLGDRVHAVWLTSGELGLKEMSPVEARRVREEEARAAARLLRIDGLTFLRCADWSVSESRADLQQALIPILRRDRPGRIYVPHPGDDHPDHQPVCHLVQSALRFAGVALPEIRGYEVWSPLSRIDYVEDITPVMPRKLRALRAHRSQLREFDYIRAVRGLNQFRGALAGKCRYAEVFQDLSFHEPAT